MEELIILGWIVDTTRGGGLGEHLEFNFISTRTDCGAQRAQASDEPWMTSPHVR